MSWTKSWNAEAASSFAKLTTSKFIFAVAAPESERLMASTLPPGETATDRESSQECRGSSLETQVPWLHDHALLPTEV
jgi:hypothetical protein